MVRFLIALAVLFAFFAAPAEAAHRHRHRHHGHHFTHHVHKASARHWHGHRHRAHVQAAIGDGGTVMAPSGLVAVAERYLGGNPTGWAHVWCARFLNAVVLPQAGVSGTGDNRAISFARWGSPSVPRPGAVAVFGHHVTIAVRINGDGTFDGLGGNQGHRVSINRFPIGRVVAWRSPA